MGSVNTGTRPLPTTIPTPATRAEDADGRSVEDVGTPGSGFLGGIASMTASLGSTASDVAGITLVGVNVAEEGGVVIEKNPVSVGVLGAGTMGGTALMALGNRVDPLTGAATSYTDRLGTTAANNAIRVTPTLASAVLGPAIADGVTMIAPNLVKKYRDTKDIRNADEKKQAEKDNQYAKVSRGVAGAVVVGLAAGAVFLLKPEIFKKFGAGVTHAIEGSTSFSVNGKAHKLVGVLDQGAIRATMAGMGAPLASDAVIKGLKTVSPMAKDAVFSNRLLMATAGGVGTLLAANKAAGEEDPDKQKLWWGITAAAGAATIGSTYGIGKLTQGSIRANGGAGGVLARNELFLKPNVEWIKKYATTIAPITAVPAYTSASQYFNIFNDFDEITATRSPFRK